MPERDAWHRSKVAQDLLQISVVGIGLQAQAALYVVQVAEPVLFMKAVAAISGPDDAILIAPTATKVDWKVGLGGGIGSRATGACSAKSAWPRAELDSSRRAGFQRVPGEVGPKGVRFSSAGCSCWACLISIRLAVILATHSSFCRSLAVRLSSAA